jgi:hypothetical protein
MPFLRFYMGALLGFLIPALGWLGLFACQIGAPTAPAKWHQLRVQWKADLARRQQGPKVLIVSGSNGLYGLSAGAISRRSAVPAFNMAATAGLGIDLILRQALPLVAAGDVVLMPLEYELYVDDGAPNTLQTDYILGCDPGYMLTMDPRHLAGMAFGLPALRMKYGLGYHRQALTGGRAAVPWPLELDAHGDQLGHSLANRGEPQRRARDLSGPISYLIQRDALAPFAQGRLTAFVAACRARGAHVVATYPVRLDVPEYHAPGVRLRLLPAIAAFYRALDVPVLGEPAAFFMPRDHFFDTGYHLTAERKLAHTERMLPLLAPHLARMKASMVSVPR